MYAIKIDKPILTDKNTILTSHLYGGSGPSLLLELLCTGGGTLAEVAVVSDVDDVDDLEKNPPTFFGAVEFRAGAELELFDPSFSLENKKSKFNK